MHPVGFDVSSPGLTVPQPILFILAYPFKRLWFADWFTPVARVGDSEGDEIPLFETVNRFTASNDGELFLYVNDAIVPLAWRTLYSNNRGIVAVSIRRVD